MIGLEFHATEYFIWSPVFSVKTILPSGLLTVTSALFGAWAMAVESMAP